MIEFLQQNLMLVAIAVASGAMLAWSFISEGGGKGGISVADATLKINREDALVLDVREPDEWSKGHIPNARHIALGQLEKRLHEIEKFKEKPVVVCCASGVRSAKAGDTLRKAGFAQVFSLNGGVSAWGEANLPLTTR
ncbi:MAG TPA: rhodanese-like domain-containing protein [Rhodocyclaceae bacterium]